MGKCLTSSRSCRRERGPSPWVLQQTSSKGLKVNLIVCSNLRGATAVPRCGCQAEAESVDQRVRGITAPILSVDETMIWERLPVQSQIKV
jgi:hypothetical protein